MLKKVFTEVEERMKKTHDATRIELSRIRTGKATTSLLDGIQVEYHGSRVPISKIANISVPEVRLLVVQPWDKTMISAIQKAIQMSDLNLTPSTDGNFIRIPIPQLTEERRKDLVKIVKRFTEEGRVTIRNIRREANDKLRSMEKEGQISEDERHKSQEKIQELTDKYIKLIDQTLQAKEKEIMEI